MTSSSLKTLLTCASAAAFAVAMPSAFAQQPAASLEQPAQHEGRRGGHGHDGFGDPARHLAKLTEKLSLTAEQQAALKPIFEAAAARRQEIRGNAALTEEDKRAQLKQLHQGVHAQLKGILTPEQQQKLQSAKGERRR